MIKSLLPLYPVLVWMLASIVWFAQDLSRFALKEFSVFDTSVVTLFDRLFQICSTHPFFLAFFKLVYT